MMVVSVSAETCVEKQRHQFAMVREATASANLTRLSARKMPAIQDSLVSLSLALIRFKVSVSALPCLAYPILPFSFKKESHNQVRAVTSIVTFRRNL